MEYIPATNDVAGLLTGLDWGITNALPEAWPGIYRPAERVLRGEGSLISSSSSGPMSISLAMDGEDVSALVDAEVSEEDELSPVKSAILNFEVELYVGIRESSEFESDSQSSPVKSEALKISLLSERFMI